ncbi:E3 ubiquitin-protein ligase RING1-like [Selaginella moellendorffii]|uniref:E3 ubiquitin-protein ligase RING1-like n=1 Tax=Selaginella moellendorffii TaxID=88036 RepID=UPI000D1CAF54|nr:E3 ubiquitin-protein ligase RING1-like [Selaginella moellendorffii]|eukprot:XP_024519747.1 E3 ubiquitin-protein ligase RING1-like [Selaginella moellendorffii]
MATALEPATYWCHQCHTSVRPNAGNDILCPFCNGGFIEEIENSPGIVFPPHRQRPTVIFGGEPGSGRETRGISADGDTPPAGNQGVRHPPIFQVLQAMSAILQQSRDNNNNNNNSAGANQRDGADHADPLDPMILVQNMFGGRGGNVEVFFDTGTGARRLPANFGDYFFGPGLDQLIQQLAENDPNRYGTPPASKTAIEAMPVVSITSEHMSGDGGQCAVCKDEFELGSEVRQMPCKHLYHGDCILPWLAQHNSCPVCRHEMPTDDPEYNNTAPGRGGAQASRAANAEIGGAAASGGGGGPGRGFTLWGSGANLNLDGHQHHQDSGSSRPAEEPRSNRRVSFQFPWPFRSSSSPPPAPAPAPPSSSSSQQQHGSSSASDQPENRDDRRN